MLEEQTQYSYLVVLWDLLLEFLDILNKDNKQLVQFNTKTIQPIDLQQHLL